MEKRYHLVTADFEKYNFHKLVEEERSNSMRVVWQNGNEDGKYAQKSTREKIYC